jgi:uncharacterized membrane protein
MSNNNSKNSNMKRLAVISLAAIALIAVAYFIPNKDNKETGKTSSNIPAVKDSDIVINTKDITEKASFYPANINGTDLEVIAVKAPDGTIRTAFNTCQVCYSSGKGYYKQEGDQLVCQNCGNRFTMDQVSVTRGGCNPVPITDEYKTVENDTITIAKDYLAEATVIFANWK